MSLPGQTNEEPSGRLPPPLPVPPPLPTAGTLEQKASAPGNVEKAPLGWIIFAALGCLAFVIGPPLILMIGYFLGGTEKQKTIPSTSPIASPTRATVPSQIQERQFNATDPTSPSGSPLGNQSSKSIPHGISKNLLSLVSVTIRLECTMGNKSKQQSFSSSGTGFVLRKQDATLRICTNRHCLSFQNLLQYAEHNFPDVIKYEVTAEFASQVRRRVTWMSPADNGVDLARLEVDGSGLTDGKDYALVPIDSSHLVELGDQVVAVGNPFGKNAGTTTWGRVSSLRSGLDRSRNEIKDMWIQHDAAINPGNSGGPLFLEKDGLYYWAGINTRREPDERAQGLFFSIAAKEVMNTTFSRYPADNLGVVDCIKDLYGGTTGK